MKVFLIHGWSVSETTTYQALHEKLAEHGYALEEIHLGRYVSLDDHVEVQDIARALHAALRDSLGAPPWSPFCFITHSTGALVAKEWIVRHYVDAFLARKPLKNVVFLAGPHFGSRLAHHGRSMLAHAAYFGATGNRVLRALELGSAFSWANNGDWLDPAHWKRKGIRPFCLIGDRVERDFLKSRIFPAGYEEGSDMVVRVPAGNLNFARYEIRGRRRPRRVGGIEGVPFGALEQYVHSGDEHGIMNAITRRADPAAPRWRNLRLILDCLGVSNAGEYEAMEARLRAETARTRAKRKAFSQLDFRIVDQEGGPVDDYRLTLGAVVREQDRASKTIVNTHKNKIDPHHFTAFVDRREFEPRYDYFLEIYAETGTSLYTYAPNPLRVVLRGEALQAMIAADQVTQIDVVMERRSSPDLFRFHPGTDPDLHVRWDREGRITRKNLETK